ncbi:MAG TPA: Bax inhibitor-1/YccA family protein [Nitrosopumilaceae archaeon]|nr:Bax inhibitor-1/YccA family protein [Nitrosopumilaceae archaeon]
MENFRNTNISQFQQAEAKTRSLLASSFSWMFLALTLSAVFAMLFGLNESLSANLYSYTEGHRSGLSVLGWVVMFAPLGFVLAMSFGWQRFSFPVLLLLFILYSAITGVSLSFIFQTYKIGKIVNVFFSTSALFGLMAVLGATTKTDLTKMGSFLMMALFGIIIASVINFFTKSSGLDYIISFVGVIVFTGLTAYDVQKIKNLDAEYTGEGRMKLGLMGALNLYLDFLNMFLMLLRLFGGRD